MLDNVKFEGIPIEIEKEMMRTLLILLLLYMASALPDTFNFANCECPGFKFSSQQKSNFPNSLVRVGHPELFSCPGNNNNPQESGVIFDLADTEGELTTTMSTDLFQDNSAKRRKPWHAALRISFTPVIGAEFSLLELTYNNFRRFRVEISVSLLPGVLVMAVTCQGHRVFLSELTLGREITLDLVLGTASNTHSRNFDFFCGSINGIKYRCGTTTANHVFFQSSSAKLSLMKPIVDSKPMRVKLSMAHFDDGATNDISLTEDNKAALIEIATDITAKMPKPLYLPILDEPIAVTTTEDTDHTIDIFDVLKGGTFSADDLSLELISNPNHGVVSTDDSFTFAYSPNQNFNGKDTLSFTYSIAYLFQCSNTLTVDITVVPEADAPVAQNFEFDVLPTTGREIFAEVATDGDEIDGRMEGTLTFDNTISGVISSSCENSVPITEFPVINGMVSFCYTPDETMIDGRSQVLEFTVTDETNLKDKGKFVFNSKANTPVAQNFEFDVFATIGREITAEVATDVDDFDGKMDGTLTFDNTISGIISDTCQSNVSITEFLVINGSISFCYTPDETMIDGASQTLVFTVTDDTNLKNTGRFIFNGNNPFFVADEIPIEIGIEDTPVNFFLGRDHFGKTAPGVPRDVLVGIRITRLPETGHGILIDSKGNNVDLITNSDFLSNEKLTFVPASGVFNAVHESPLDAAGKLVGSCSQRVDINGNEGICPISFEYKVVPGDAQTNSTQAFFIINAVDRESPQITVNGVKEANFGSVPVPNVTIISDPRDIFQVKMQISSSEGLGFKIKIPANPIGFEFTDGMNHEASLLNCTIDSCALVDVLGVPSQLEEVANNLLIDSVPEDGFPLINFELVSSSESFGDGDSIRVYFRNEGSAPVFNPAGIIGGTVGGVLVLAIIIGVVIYLSEKRERELVTSRVATNGILTSEQDESNI